MRICSLQKGPMQKAKAWTSWPQGTVRLQSTHFSDDFQKFTCCCFAYKLSHTQQKNVTEQLSVDLDKTVRRLSSVQKCSKNFGMAFLCWRPTRVTQPYQGPDPWSSPLPSTRRILLQLLPKQRTLMLLQKRQGHEPSRRSQQATQASAASSAAPYPEDARSPEVGAFFNIEQI